jgi:hypothetical protein
MTARYGHRTLVGESVSQTWGKPQTNLFPFPVANQITNTSFTNGAVAHTKSAWAEMVASVSADCNLLMVDTRTAVSNAETSYLIDIAVGPSGSETIIAENVFVGMSLGSSPRIIPLTVPIGSRLSGRIQSNRTTGTINVQIKLYAGTTYNMPQTVDVMGTDTSNSRATIVASSATWTEVVASTSKDYQALVFCPSNISATQVGQALAVRLGVGAAVSETEIAIGAMTITGAESVAVPSTGSAVNIAGTASTLTNIYTTRVNAGSRLSLYVDANGGQAGGFIIGVPA